MKNHRRNIFIVIVGLLLWSNFTQAELLNGAQKWVNTCARCHNLRGPTEYSSEQWDAIVMHMRLQAGLNGQDAQDIYNFLSSQSPEKPKSLKNQKIDKPNTAPVQKTSKNIKNTQSNLEAGKAIYEQHCTACHGATGTGAVPGTPNFTEKKSRLLASNATLLKHIEEGFQSPGSTMAMPAKGGDPDLSAEQLKAVLDYMKHTFIHN